jgi:predicted permease
VAFSLALLSGAGLMLRSFIKLQRVDPGFAQERVLTMALDLDSSKYATPADEVVAGHAIVDKVESLPGVVSAAISSSFPLDPDALAMGYNTVAMFTSRILIEGKPVPAGEVVPLVPYRLASTDYFKTLGIPLTQGRTFLPTDKQGAPGVIVVNQAFARHRLAPDDPIGKRISWDGGKTWLSVVGVVGNTKEFSLKENLSDEVYYPMDQVPIGAVGSLLVRTAVNPMSISREIQRAIRDAAPDTAVSYLTTLEDARKDTLVAPRVMTSLLSLFAGLALAVAASGIGGILALSVSQRVKEIGIRLAVGATPWDVLTMIVKQGLILVAIGRVCGLGITLAMARTLQAFLFDVAPADPLTLTAVCALLGITALVACYIPARRATKINPVVALQHE